MAAAVRAQRRAATERPAAEGRWDEMDSVPPTAADDVEDWAIQLRDRWWRPVRTGRETDLAGGDPAGDVMARRRHWLAAGGQAPHPMPAAGEPDPLPVPSSALVLDRQRRLAAVFDDSGRLDAPELNEALRHAPADVEGATLAAIRMGLEKIDYAYDSAELGRSFERGPRRRQQGQQGSMAARVFAALGALLRRVDPAGVPAAFARLLTLGRGHRAVDSRQTVSSGPPPRGNAS
ncbi:MAG: hypothetical protein R3F05_15515 [Planctomycetota bacterium]